jgi:hypothetical protein
VTKKVNPSIEDLQWAITQQNSAVAASKVLGISYTTFIRRCKEHGIYAPNQGGKGTKKPNPKARVPLEKILSNEHFAAGRMIKQKLLEAGLIKEECEGCGLGPMWNGKKLTLQLDHVDGDNSNNARINLRLLCPNCHTQTPTFSRGKWKRNALVAELVDAQR